MLLFQLSLFCTTQAIIYLHFRWFNETLILPCEKCAHKVWANHRICFPREHNFQEIIAYQPFNLEIQEDSLLLGCASLHIVIPKITPIPHFIFHLSLSCQLDLHGNSIPLWCSNHSGFSFTIVWPCRLESKHSSTIRMVKKIENRYIMIHDDTLWPLVQYNWHNVLCIMPLRLVYNVLWYGSPRMHQTGNMCQPSWIACFVLNKL